MTPPTLATVLAGVLIGIISVGQLSGWYSVDSAIFRAGVLLTGFLIGVGLMAWWR